MMLAPTVLAAQAAFQKIYLPLAAGDVDATDVSPTADSGFVFCGITPPQSPYRAIYVAKSSGSGQLQWYKEMPLPAGVFILPRQIVECSDGTLAILAYCNDSFSNNVATLIKLDSGGSFLSSVKFTNMPAGS
jgi:hypothetical protein